METSTYQNETCKGYKSKLIMITPNIPAKYKSFNKHQSKQRFGRNLICTRGQSQPQKTLWIQSSMKMQLRMEVIWFQWDNIMRVARKISKMEIWAKIMSTENRKKDLFTYSSRKIHKRQWALISIIKYLHPLKIENMCLVPYNKRLKIITKALSPKHQWTTKE